MANIAEIDPNFKVGEKINKEDVVFYNALNAPFKIYGVFMENGRFCRLPEAVAQTVSEGVHSLSTNTAGGRIRFKTDSSYIAISVKLPQIRRAAHMPLTGSSGFDLYAKDETGLRFVRTFVPSIDMTDGYESVIELGEGKMREFLIHMPTYSDVSAVFVGVAKDAAVEAPAPYKHEKPIVYYGSSITQGGCSSRPGNTYQSVISRRFDVDHINLGFSGNAKGEDEIADYIAGLDMSVFVYDYDHNAPTDEHLEKTHERMFKKIRAAHPTLPILILPRPRYYPDAPSAARFPIIERTYKNAVASGDKRVWFMDGHTLMALCRDEGVVDYSHPNDFGFASMAKAIGDWIEENKILELI